MATLVLITSSTLYIYIRYNSNAQLEISLKKQADYLLKKYPNLEQSLYKKKDILKNTLNIEAKIECAPFIHYRPLFFRIIKVKNRYFIQGFFPYDFSSQNYLILSKDITEETKLEKVVYKAVIFTNIISLIIIVFYAYFLSSMLIKPLKFFSQKITKMNESKLSKIDTKALPIEFLPLGKSINKLINKIEHFIYYKKELFIGAAHELKTPLAVMKTKSQVTLLKKDKSIKSLTEAIEQNIKSINNLNSIVESILAFGRAEGVQFEEAKNIDIVKLIDEIVNEFEIIAIKERKIIIRRFYLNSLIINIQPMLVRHIIQNIIQNAIQFTPKGEKITVSLFKYRQKLYIRVKDNGIGLEKDFDIFAPFKRSKISSGTGLGLFLAKSAADSIGAKIALKNRNKVSGAVSTIILPINSKIKN